jgi:ParB-like chromosome segregation protein Spo0J
MAENNSAGAQLPANMDPALHARIMGAPVSSVQWVHRESLHPNNYNPNKVAPPEIKLLINSILEDGFTQPIVISRQMEAETSEGESLAGRYRDMIVDGFHRYTVSGYPEVMAVYGGYVPTVFLTPMNAAHQKMSTIRHNRARGTHGVLPMAEIVQSLIEVDKLSVPEIMARLQMEKDEVVRLANRAGIPDSKLIMSTPFSQSWVPSK